LSTTRNPKEPEWIDVLWLDPVAPDPNEANLHHFPGGFWRYGSWANDGVRSRANGSIVLTSDDLGPVDHPLTLEPGQSAEAEFVLRATTPGRATLTGSTSFEIHALDYSWGSRSGCRSWPPEIVVTPATDTD